MLADYNPDYHYFQFYIIRQGCESNRPEGWVRSKLGEWSAYTCPHLPRIPVMANVARETSQVGWILGIAIDSDSQLVSANQHCALPSACTSNVDRLESWLAGIRGRYIVFLSSGTTQRLYMDPMGSLATVYSKESPIIASTWSLIKNPNNTELYSALKGYPCNEPCKYYPAGLTRSDDVARLLPNFHLDLNRWRAARHWPKVDIDIVTEFEAMDLRSCVARDIGESVAAVGTDTGLYIGATAGQDARLIVGCVPEHLKFQSELVTFSPRWRGQTAVSDLQTGAKVAKVAGMTRRILTVPANDLNQMSEFLRRIGIAAGAGKGMSYYYAAKNSLDLGKTWLTGFGGEVLRTFCFKDEAISSRRYSEDELLRSIELPLTERFRGALREWRATLPHERGRFLLDQLYYEIRHGCWAMPLQYGTANFSRNLTPFSSRHLIEICYSFPHDVRRNLGIFVLEEVAPELAEIPTNTLSGASLAARRLFSNRFYRVPVWLGRR